MNNLFNDPSQPTRTLADLTGSPKQIAWALEVRDRILSSPLLRGKDPQDLADLHRVASAAWWIQVRDLPLTDENVRQLIAAAWVMNQDLDVPGASYSQVRSGLRNGGQLNPLQHGFTRLATNYTHLLTLRNGNRHLVSATTLDQLNADKAWAPGKHEQESKIE